MKRSKRIYTLLAVLLVSCIAAFAAINYEEKQEQIKNSEETILAIASDTVTSLYWDNEGNVLSFHKDETWFYDEDDAFPVDEDKINELLAFFEDFGSTFVIEEADDLGQYGLDAPVGTIQITTTENTYEIKLGNFSTMDSQRYVSIGDGNVYLVGSDPLEVYNVVLSDLLLHDTVPVFETVTSLAFTGTSESDSNNTFNYEIAYKEESTDTYNSEDVYFAQINGASLPLDTTTVTTYLDNISVLSLTNFVNYKVTEEELVEYGLDDPENVITIQYTYEDEDEKEVTEEFVISAGRNPEDVAKLAETNTETDEGSDTSSESEDSGEDTEEEIPAYVRIGDSSIIYEISSTEYENLMACSYNDLRHKEIFSGNFEDIYQIDITLEDTDYTLTGTKSEDEDEGTIWIYQDEEIEMAGFNTALGALTADSFVIDKPEGKVELSLTLYLNNENYPEINIVLYRHDGNLCLATVNGETVALVERALVVDLIESVNGIVLN